MQARPNRIEEYVRQDGTCPYREWFDALDVQAAARVATAVMRLAAGNTSTLKWLGDIGEIRVDSGPGYRIYVAHGPGSIVLLGGGTKRQQARDIRRARGLRIEFKARLLVQR